MNGLTGLSVGGEVWLTGHCQTLTLMRASTAKRQSPAFTRLGTVTTGYSFSSSRAGRTFKAAANRQILSSEMFR